MPNQNSLPKLPRRQVHLDFHNSPHIPGICEQFDAEAFAETMARAQVDSVTVFARCIHGMAYYPTKIGHTHPHLAAERDFLGEAIEALHRRGIRAPIYATVTWEEGVAAEHPEWRQMFENGRLATMNTFMDESYVPGSQWKVLDFIHPDYMDYVEAYLTEILQAYTCDGFFIDMLFYVPNASWSRAARDFRHRYGIQGNDLAAHYALEAKAQAYFAERMTGLIHQHAPKATVFYNTPNNLYNRRDLGASARWPHQTHIEIESLPSGIWGYQHFPRVARRMLTSGKEWLGMTGRFQKMWGDFGGIKPQPALEYECFRTQALGGANSVGDQLLPDGRLDPDAYDLIGAVFAQCAEAEPFYGDSTQIRDIGILAAARPDPQESAQHLSEDGAIQLCTELRYECALLDDQCDWEDYRLILLPDDVHVDAALAERIHAYRAAGGRILASHQSAWDTATNWMLGGEAFTLAGEAERFPNYWLPSAAGPAAGTCGIERVFYNQGLNVEFSSSAAEIWIERIEPWFQRDDLHYCSHFQTPSSGKASPYPACVHADGLVYFADPIFREYRERGNGYVKTALRAVLDPLIGPPRISGPAATVESSLRRKGDDLLITLLHYLPVRKAVDCEVIESRLAFDRQLLRIDRAVDALEVFPDGTKLAKDSGGSYTLPPADGRILLCAKNYFRP
jgi:hypothetical protein